MNVCIRATVLSMQVILQYRILKSIFMILSLRQTGLHMCSNDASAGSEARIILWKDTWGEATFHCSDNGDS
jgi:hypothetical protein